MSYHLGISKEEQNDVHHEDSVEDYHEEKVLVIDEEFDRGNGFHNHD